MKASIILLLIVFTLSSSTDLIDNGLDCKSCIWLFKTAYRNFCEPKENYEDFPSQISNSPPHPSFVFYCRKCSKNIRPEDCEAYFALRTEEKRKEAQIKECIDHCIARGLKIDCTIYCTPPLPMY